jgi:hypothetical protein
LNYNAKSDLILALFVVADIAAVFFVVVVADVVVVVVVVLLSYVDVISYLRRLEFMTKFRKKSSK